MEIMAENFPSHGQDMDIYIHKVQKFPRKIIPKMITPRHSVN